jgi:hypothetical protein
VALGAQMIKFSRVLPNIRQARRFPLVGADLQ